MKKMSTKKGKAKPSSVVQTLIDNMEIIYWTQIEMFAQGMLLQAVQKRLQEADRDG
jgi:phosphoribosyl-ATP pyrophosphohydrolase